MNIISLLITYNRVELEKFEMPDTVWAIYSIFLGISILGFIFCYIFLQRNKRVCFFVNDVINAVYLAHMADIAAGRKPKYVLDDIEECMWSYNKILGRFWIKKKRKVFYDPGLYDHVEKFMSSRLYI